VFRIIFFKVIGAGFDIFGNFNRNFVKKNFRLNLVYFRLGVVIYCFFVNLAFFKLFGFFKAFLLLSLVKYDLGGDRILFLFYFIFMIFCIFLFFLFY
jgi:hypothetical protein